MRELPLDHEGTLIARQWRQRVDRFGQRGTRVANPTRVAQREPEADTQLRADERDEPRLVGLPRHAGKRRLESHHSAARIAAPQQRVAGGFRRVAELIRAVGDRLFDRGQRTGAVAELGSNIREVDPARRRAVS
jgi:hypothetical protein